MTKTILYTRSIDKSYLERIIKSDVKGILHTIDTPLTSKGDKFLKIFKAVSHGIICIDNIITSNILKPLWAKGSEDPLICNVNLNEGYAAEGYQLLPDKNLKFLTHKEIEIILHIAQGRKNKEIAEILHISVDTIEQHKAHIKNKLNLKSASEIPKFILSHIKDVEL